jgi:protease-4
MLGWIGLLICVLTILSMHAQYEEYFGANNELGERYHSGSKSASDKVAIIEVRGAIMEGDGFVKQQIDRVTEDEHVKGVVLRVNSPGGTVTGSDYIYHHLRELVDERDIPLVVSMGALAASGGYYVAMAVGDQEDSIFAEPTTTTGSIGVILPHYDLSGLMEKYDITNDAIVSHPRKQLLSMTRPISEEDRDILQRYVDQAFSRFKNIVMDGRPDYKANPDKLDKVATGEIFSAEQAKIEGLVDRIGFIDDAIDRCIELTGLDQEDVRVVKYKRPLTLLEAVGAGASITDDPQMSLLEMTVPRVYYMLTTLPGLRPATAH